MSHRQYWLLNGMRTATHSENEILFLMHRQVLEGEHE